MSDPCHNAAAEGSVAACGDVDALRRSEQRYRALIEATSQAVWSWTLDGEASDFERAQLWWQELTGQSVKEQQSDSDSWLAVVHPDDRSAASEAWMAARASGTTYDVCYRVQGRDGWRVVRARGVPVRSCDGTVREWIGTLDDVTAQRDARLERERLLGEAEAERRRLADVFQHAPSFMAVLRGPQHVFERVNDRYVELIGGRDVVGRPVREALPEVEAQGYFELLDQVYRTGIPHLAADARVLLHNPSAATERILQFVYQPMIDADGTVSGVLVQGIDLTERRRAESEFARISAESERQRRMYETVLSNTVDFLYLFDLEGRFTYVNKALLDLWGKDLSQAVGKNFFDLDYPGDLATKLQQQIQTVIQSGEPLRDETLYTSSFGTSAYEYIFTPVFGAGGKIEGVAGSTRDITDRKSMEEALRASEGRHRALVTATSDVVYRMSADWLEMQPLDGRDFLTSTLEPIHGWMDQNVPQFEQPRTWEAIHKAIREKGMFELEHQVIRVDGSLGWTFSRAVPILDECGEIIEWFGTARDVTRRKQAEEDLVRVTGESERRKRVYEAILSNTPDFAYVFDLNHRFTYANEVLLRMWGLTWDQAIGKTFVEIGYEPWHAAMHIREIDEVKATGNPIRGEVPFNGTFGPRIYDYIFIPIFGENGGVEAVAGTTRDVTERKKSEEALREADRKKDDFLALLAHELRNPLAPIRNGLQVMRLAADNAELVAHARDIMDRQLSHMVRLIDDLLDVSRITRNKMELRRSRVTLAEIVSSAVETANPMVQENHHELTVLLPPDSIVLNADLTRLAQVFSNLLTNSAKYTPPGGQVWLSARQSNDQVIVTVTDTGIGIPANALSTIFDMFSQVDRSVERNSGGLGIGLALVKGLVEMHGGSVCADSVEGQGSTFTVRLPIDKPASLSGESMEHVDPTLHGRRRVLVVDDNRDGANSMAMMLRLLGNEVNAVHDGLEAVAAAESFRPDVILMDIGLPLLNGLDATRRIREQVWGRAMTVIALTGWGQDVDREQSQQAGCDGHLVKPVNLADLEKLLEAARET